MWFFRPALPQINAFLEDTCVLVTLAYLLSRSPLLPVLFDRARRRRGWLALVLLFGLIGASDLVFPGYRRPFIPFTLVASLAGYAGGLRMGLASSGLMLALSIPHLVSRGSAHHAAVFCLSLVTAPLLGAMVAVVRGRDGVDAGGRSRRGQLAGALIAGAGAEALHACWHVVLPGHRPALLALASSVAANGFGSLVIFSILRDANERREAAQRLVRSERELASSRLSQLNQLQARLHPHFLFNALAAIAGLCVLNPPEAERAVTTLAGLLRRFLRTPDLACVPLREELDTVAAYLEIERLRHGDRLGIVYAVPDALMARQVPRFCLQIPAENAVQHGLAPLERSGQVCIVARTGSAGHLTLAVMDDGAGVPARLPAHSETAPHGLALLRRRVELSCGPAARMRLCSRAGRGTVFVLRLPPESDHETPHFEAPNIQASDAEVLAHARALVVDDEPLARAHLAFLLREMGIGVVDEARDGNQCLAFCRRTEERPDWVFLDVRMPGMDGMAVADALRAHAGVGGPPPAVVFVTGYEDFAVQAFERSAVDYLLKPVARARLAATLERLAGRAAIPGSGPSRLQRLPVRTDYAVRLLDTGQIVAAAAHDKRVEIITPDAVYPTYYTLADLEGRLPPGDFLRVHDGWIVNLSRVIELHNLGGQTYQLTLRDSSRPVPVSRRRLRKLQQCLGI